MNFAAHVLADPGRVVVVQARTVHEPTAPACARCATRRGRRAHDKPGRYRRSARALRSRRSDPARAAAARLARLRRTRCGGSPRTRRARLPDRRDRDAQRARAVRLVRTARRGAVAHDALTGGATRRRNDDRPPDAQFALAAQERLVGLCLPERRGTRCACRYRHGRRAAGERERHGDAGKRDDRPRRLLRSQSRVANDERSRRALTARRECVNDRDRSRTAALRGHVQLPPLRRAARTAERPADHAHRASGRLGKRARNDGSRGARCAGRPSHRRMCSTSNCK